MAVSDVYFLVCISRGRSRSPDSGRHPPYGQGTPARVAAWCYRVPGVGSGGCEAHAGSGHPPGAGGFVRVRFAG